MTNPIKNEILEHDTNVPRYTSYPTAPHFTVASEYEEYLHALQAIQEDDDLSLYIHVPFCQKMCWYCGCHTKISRRYGPVEDYLYLLFREIDILAGTFPKERTVKLVHLGGGSPGLLRGCDFELLVSRLKHRFRFTKDTEIAIELDPRGVTEGRVAAYAKNGVNRVSLGVQDFNQTVMKAVNREQPFHVSYEAVQLLRQYGIENVNVDLMYGLPHQSLETVEYTFSNIKFLDPDRISYFGYAHVPWMKKHMRMIEEDTLPQKDLRFDLFEAGQELLLAMGYQAIGIDHFAKADDSLCASLKAKTLHRNFQGYTDDNAEALVGLGASSIGETQDAFFQNHPDMPLYKEAVLAGHLPVKKMYRKTQSDKIRAQIIEHVMCYLSLDLKAFCETHEIKAQLFEKELNDIKKLEKFGLVNFESPYSFTIPQNAKLMTRLIASAFDENIGEAPLTKRHAAAI